MLKLQVSIVLILSLFTIRMVYSQETTIVDEAFEQALIDLGYDDVIDGYVLTSNISNIEYLDVSNRYIEDLKGIEDFSNLKELFCQKNYLLYLDLRENIILKKLNFNNSNGHDYEPLPINLSENINLEYLNCSGNRIFKLNVGHMPNLKYLNYSSNKIGSIDISNNTKLEELYCSYNNLQSLSTQSNSSLTVLDCSGNMLKSINLTNNTKLTSLRLGGNQLSLLDLNKNINLEQLYFGSNPITEINLSELGKLKAVYCVYNHSLSSLDLSQNLSIEEVSCFQNDNLKEINILGCIKLKYLNCRTNQLESLDLSTNVNLEVLWAQNNKLMTLDLMNNVNLEFLKCENNQLETLYLKNGTNSLMKGGEILYDGVTRYMHGMNASGNPLLKCIEVDNEINATNGVEPYSEWIKDDLAFYSENCTVNLGVDDEIFSNRLEVFPNPVYNILSIKSETIHIYRAEIYSYLGIKIIEISSGFEHIPTDKLSKGIYIITIYSEKGRVTRRLIKQ